MKLSSYRLLLVLLLGVASCGGGGGAPEPPKPPPTKEQFTYAGRVVDENNNPVPLAILQLSLLSTRTDTNGNFRFDNLAGGHYNLSVQGPDGTFSALSLSVTQNATDAIITLSSNPHLFALVRVSPSLNAVDVPLNAEIILTFSRTVSPNPPTFHVSVSPPLTSSTINVEGNVLAIRPTYEFAESQRYRVTVSRDLKDTGGTSLGVDSITYFTTSGTDDVPPVVVSTTPSNDATSVVRNPEIVLSFSDNLSNGQRLDTDNTQISPPTPLNVKISGSTLVLTPQELLAPNTTYALTVDRITDDSGNVSGAFTLSFTTGTTVEYTDDVEPDWTRYGNLVVFSRKSGGNYDLYLLDMQTSLATRLTDSSANERHPRFSSDAKRIVFQSDENRNWDIFTYELHDRTYHQLTSSLEDEVQPDFSGTFSQLIAFVKVQSFNLPRKIYTMYPDGTFQREADTTFFRNEYEPAFHPLVDGQLLFITDEGGDQDVYVKSGFLSGDTIINANLTSAQSSNETFAGWSADGGQIAVISDNGGKKNIWLFDPSGAVYRQLTNFPDDVHSLAMSPVPGDDTAIASVGQVGRRRLVLISMVTGEVIEDLT